MSKEAVTDLIQTLKGIAEWIEGMPIPTKGATAKLIKIDQAIKRAEAAVAMTRQQESDKGGQGASKSYT